jgi:hypothetical protein
MDNSERQRNSPSLCMREGMRGVRASIARMRFAGEQ